MGCTSRSSSSEKIGRGAALVVCAALAARVAVAVAAWASAGRSIVFEAPDTDSYIRLAERMVAGAGFTIGGRPEIVRTPGFPLLLIPGVVAGHVTAVTVGLQIALGAATAWLVYRTALLITGRPGAAICAGLLAACEPLSILYCSMLLSETLFTTLLVTFVYLFTLSLRTERVGYLLGAALTLAAAIYTRPVAYWLPLPAALFLLAGPRRRGGRRPLRALCFFSLSAVLVGSWQVRNMIEAGYAGFSAITDYYLYFYQGAAVVAAETGRSYYEVQREMGYGDLRCYLARHPDQRATRPAERLEAMGREGLALIAAHPRTFAGIYVKGMIRALLDPGGVDYLKLFGAYREGSGLLGEIVDRGLVRSVIGTARRRPAVFFVNLALGIVLCLYLALAGIGLVGRGRSGVSRAALIVTGAYLLLLAGGANAHGRLRTPLMPIVCVLAGCTLDRLRRGGGAGRSESSDYYGGEGDL